jgi:hypothetical protein
MSLFRRSSRTKRLGKTSDSPMNRAFRTPGVTSINHSPSRRRKQNLSYTTASYANRLVHRDGRTPQRLFRVI